MVWRNTIYATHILAIHYALVQHNFYNVYCSSVLSFRYPGYRVHSTKHVVPHTGRGAKIATFTVAQARHWEKADGLHYLPVQEDGCCTADAAGASMEARQPAAAAMPLLFVALHAPA